MNETQLPAKLDDILSQKVKARLNEELSTLVPEETLTAAVRENVSEWIKDELPKLIKNALEEKVNKIVQSEINAISTDGFVDHRPNSDGIPINVNAEFIKTLVKEHADDLVAGMFSTIIRAAAYNAADGMRNGRF